VAKRSDHALNCDCGASLDSEISLANWSTELGWLRETAEAVPEIAVEKETTNRGECKQAHSDMRHLLTVIRKTVDVFLGSTQTGQLC
jgi:hypothetical protein